MERRQDIEDLDDAVSAKRLKHMKQLMLEAYGENPQFGPMLRGMISRWASLGDIAGIVNRWLINSPEEKMAVLSEDSRDARELKLEELLRENLEFHKVNTEANSAQEEEYQKMYRENALKKQIEYLQKQLDSLHPEKVSDLRRFELKIQDLGMNESAKAEAEKVLKRLQQEGQQTAESGMLYDYLDYVTNLPWKKESAQEIDLAAAEQVLEEDHYGLKKVKNRILQQIAVMSLKGQQSGSILLFVGAPGTGKTTLVPPLGAQILTAPDGDRRVIVTQPRRVAARAAARRLATLLDEPLGATIGYAVRGERRTGPRTRVEIVTAGAAHSEDETGRELHQ